MKESLKVILDIQELDMKMIRLMRLKKERQKELHHLHSIINDIKKQLTSKENQALELKKHIRALETQIAESCLRIERLEGKQNAVKKVEEFNALSHEISSAEREKTALEQQLADLGEKLGSEEEAIKQLADTLKSTEENSRSLGEEITKSIELINEEGTGLQKERDVLKEKAHAETLKIYERLLYNRKNRVLVPIENRTCSGCHIVLTAQHENLVRRAERLVFCEHCSRIHYWQEGGDSSEAGVAPVRRRRRRSSAAGT